MPNVINPDLTIKPNAIGDLKSITQSAVAGATAAGPDLLPGNTLVLPPAATALIEAHTLDEQADREAIVDGLLAMIEAEAGAARALPMWIPAP